MYNPILGQKAIEQAQIVLYNLGLLQNTVVSVVYTESDNMSLQICIPNMSPILLGFAGFWSLTETEVLMIMDDYIESSIKQALKS